MDDSENPVLRGISRAKGFDLVPVGLAIGGGVYLFAEGSVAATVGGVLSFIYATIWLFANASSAVLLIVRNVNQTRLEIAQRPLSENENRTRPPPHP